MIIGTTGMNTEQKLAIQDAARILPLFVACQVDRLTSAGRPVEMV